MGDSVRSKVSRLLLSEKRRRNYLTLFTCVALVLGLTVSYILRRHGVALTHEETVLDCPYAGNGAHTHNADCYDADGNLVCPLEEKSLHTHDDSCYSEETVLTCTTPEGEGAHTHTDECYDESGELVCGLEESEGHVHTDECYETVRTLICTQEEITEEHVHGDGCFKTIVVADAMPEQELWSELKDVEDRLVVRVTVEAPEGALPAGATLKLDALDSDANLDRTVAAVQGEMGDKVYVSWGTAVGVTVLDANGVEFVPEKPVVVKFTSGYLRGTTATALVALDKRSNDAWVLREAALVNEDDRNHNEDTRDTLRLETNDPQQYMVTAIEPLPEEDEPAAETEIVEGMSSEGTSDGQTPAVDDGDAPGTKATDAETGAEPVTETDDAPENDGDSPATETDDSPADEADESSADAALSADAQTFEASTDSVAVTVVAPAGALPEGVMLVVQDLEPGSVQGEVEAAVKSANDGAQVKSLTAVDITFRDAKGNEVKPTLPVEVRITSGIVRDLSNPVLVHVGTDDEQATQVVDAELVNSANENFVGDEDTFKFEADAFSPFVIVELETITTQYLTADGYTYDVTVEAPASAGIPEGAKLEVSEITASDADYDTYYNKASKLYESLTYARFFDITIVKDGKPVQPLEPVSVSINLQSGAAGLTGSVQALHFDSDNNVETIDATLDGETVSFEASGFSVYAVVDDPIIVAESRMTLNFYNGDTLIATVYVKNDDDTMAEMEQIIYDPGAGTLNRGELFKGWILDNPNYGTEDVNSKMAIDDIRTWALEKANNDSITEDEVHNFYAMIYKTFSVAYKDNDGTTIHSVALIFKASDGGVTYVVNQPYTPKEQDQAFTGWFWTNSDGTVADPIVATNGSTQPFPNGTEVTIKDNIVFMPSTPNGYWLSFVENGDGASYTPPQFIQTGDVTLEPDDPVRYGYTFGGWYENPACTGARFTFGQTMSARTTLYAKWTPVPQAKYNVVIWRQNLAGDGYDFENAITLTGPVNTTINTVGAQGAGNGRYARVNGVNYTYNGFHLNTYDTGVTIVPEDTAVVNVYYDRNSYSVKFYYARMRNRTNNNDTWYLATAITTNQELHLTDRTTWSNTGVTWRQQNSYGPSTQYEVRGDYRYYYFTIDALYGQDITDQWPRYDQFPDMGDYQLISWWMMHSAGAWGGAGGGKDTVKGIISVMDEQLLGDVNSSDGNFLIARYSNSQPNVYNYKIWKELPEGFDVPTNDNGTPKQTTIRNGVRYYLDEVLIAKANSDPGGIHQPSYMGFDYKDGGDYTYRSIRDLGGGRYEYDVEMYYARDKFKIEYMDGLYVNGNGVILDDQTGVPLHETGDIYYESDIHSYNKGGANYYEESRIGYVFVGWYTDKACQHEAVFTELPDHNITVYAKWVQKQYRVFLHPNVPVEDTSFDMGGQSTSFRVDYNDKIAGGNQINGTRDEYTLIGWYTDPGFDHPFNFDAFTLNDTTVTTPYDQTEDTELDKYGTTRPGEEGNKDADNNRFWIDTKLDLYAKWRAKLTGSRGINVIYDAVDGTNAPTDPLQYLDNSEGTAGAASTPNDEDKQFLHWVVQTWDESANDGAGGYVDTDTIVYPGDIFTVLKANARVEDIPTDDPDYDEEYNSKKYTVQLRAEYGDKEAPTPTHIDWYPNYGDNYTIQRDKELQINEPAVVCPKPTRDGYKFLGWARVPETTSHSHEVDGSEQAQADVLNLGEDDLFLTYHEEDGGYYTAVIDGTSKKVTKVAADEKQPYHDMYAVWKKAYTVTVVKAVDSPLAEDKTTGFSFTAQKNEGGVVTSYSDASGNTFTLADGQQKVVFGDILEGALFSTTETPNSSFTTTLAATYLDDEGVEHDLGSIGNGQTLTIQGNTTVTVTNKRKVYSVDIAKTDNGNPPADLTGATFYLNRKDSANQWAAYAPAQIDLTEQSFANLGLVAGDYELIEADAPDGYIILSNKVYFTVASDGTVTMATGTDPALAEVLAARTTGSKGTVTVKNTPGQELPVTGGSGFGTLLYSFVGSTIMTLGLITLERRRRALARAYASRGRRR